MCCDCLPQSQGHKGQKMAEQGTWPGLQEKQGERQQYLKACPAPSWSPPKSLGTATTHHPRGAGDTGWEARSCSLAAGSLSQERHHVKRSAMGIAQVFPPQIRGFELSLLNQAFLAESNSCSGQLHERPRGTSRAGAR